MSDEEDLGFNLSADEIVVSVFRAYRHAMGLEPNVDVLPGDEPERWASTVRSAMLWLQDFDGKPACDAAMRLMEFWALGDEGLRMREAPYLHAWEAAVRHLNILLDSDEEADLDSLEQSWGEWAARRQRRQHEEVRNE
jgi:hypothetical protein